MSEAHGKGSRLQGGASNLEAVALTLLRLDSPVVVNHPRELIEAFSRVASRARALAEQHAVPT
jgi:hypothetical protein